MSRDLGLIRKTALMWVPIAALAYLYDILRDTGAGLNSGGRPLGDDFINYWTGAYLAWHGRAAEIFNMPAYHAFQESVVGNGLDPYHYGYPPVLLILTAPLAILPYLPALFAWLAASWFAFYRALRTAMPNGGALLLSLATPALFVNAYGGQNGAWSATLLGGGLSLLERRPVLAGALFGLLIYKPHLGLLIPIALLAGRQWLAMASAAATAAVLIAASVALFGIDMWRDFAHVVSMLRQLVLEDGEGVWHRIVSVFMFARRLGLDVQTAYVVQAIAGLAAAAVVALAWLRDAPAPLRNAALVLGTFLTTPYLQDYDLVVGAFVAVWLMSAESFARAPERQVLAAAAAILILPLLAAPLAQTTGLAFGPLFVIPAFALTAKMIAGERKAAVGAAR